VDRPIEAIARLQPHARTQGHTSLTLVDAAARAAPTTTPIQATIHAMIVWPMLPCRPHCAGSQLRKLLGEKETLEISMRAHFRLLTMAWPCSRVVLFAALAAAVAADGADTVGTSTTRDPTPARVPECSDGVDNDGDGLK
jgi:hypothetical protein